MKNFIQSIKDIWSIEELRNRLILTIGLVAVYRFGAQVTLPGIDASQLEGLAAQTDGGIGGLLNMFTGGAFSQASVFALGIMPYISASIVVQLMGIAIPYLQKLQKEGESGRKKINQISLKQDTATCILYRKPSTVVLMAAEILKRLQLSTNLWRKKATLIKILACY